MVLISNCRPTVSTNIPSFHESRTAVKSQASLHMRNMKQWRLGREIISFSVLLYIFVMSCNYYWLACIHVETIEFKMNNFLKQGSWICMKVEHEI